MWLKQVIIRNDILAEQMLKWNVTSEVSCSSFSTQYLQYIKSPKKHSVIIFMSSIYIGTFLKSEKCLNDLLNKRWCFNEVGDGLDEDYATSLGWKLLLHLPVFSPPPLTC